MRVKKILSMLISCCLIFALVGSFQIITNANPTSYWCLTHKQTNCNHCSTHTMQTAGTSTATSCTVGHGAIRACLTSGCGKVFYQYPPSHLYNSYGLCYADISCGKIEDATSNDFQYYMYRTIRISGSTPANFMSNGPSGHDNKGIDITTGIQAGIKNFPIYAQGNGTVYAVGGNNSDSRGFYVEIDYGNEIRVRYLHLRQNSTLMENALVTQSTFIGYTGNTGLGYSATSSQGYHLHQDVKDEGAFTEADDFYPSGTFR